MFKRAAAEFLSGIAVLVGVFMISRYAGLAVSQQSVHIGREKPVVVLDAGHGGGQLRDFFSSYMRRSIRLFCNF